MLIQKNPAAKVSSSRAGAFSASGQALLSYKTSVWYKMNGTTEATGSTTDPIYVIHFFDDLDQPAKAFTVTINTATGKVIRTYTPGSVFEQTT